MALMFLLCAMKRSVTDLDANPWVAWEMPSSKEYLALCQRINNTSGTGPQDKSMWTKTEAAVNETLCLLVFSDNPGFNYLIGIDNDKVHCKFSSGTNHDGLKQQRHVRDNR